MDGIAAQFTIWLFFNLFFQTIALLFTHFIAPFSEASGIFYCNNNGAGVGGLKAFFNGAKIETPFLFATLLGRLLMLPLVTGTGIYMGKTGIYIPIC